MNTLHWLLIGHLVGDWLLQNHWMAQGKKGGLFTLAGTAHVTIYTTAIICTLWLSGVTNQDLTTYLVLGALVLISHWLVDVTGVVKGWMRFYRQSDLAMVRVMVDQTVHILILALVTQSVT